MKKKIVGSIEPSVSKLRRRKKELCMGKRQNKRFYLFF